MPPAYRAIDSVAPRAAKTAVVMNPSLDQMCGCGYGRTVGEVREGGRNMAMGRCECWCGRSEREVFCACGCVKTVAEIREWERGVRRCSGGCRVKKCGFGCGRTEKEVREWEREARREEMEKRAARKECEGVRQMARDRYRGGGTRERCGWDLGGVNVSLVGGSGKLGNSRSGRQAG